MRSGLTGFALTARDHLRSFASFDSVLYGEHPIGKVFGPFRYEINLRNELLSAVKRELEAHPAWLNGMGRHWVADSVIFTPIGLGAAIRAIEVDGKADQLDVRAEMPVLPEPGLMDMQNARQFMSNPLPITELWQRLDGLEDSDRIFARVEYIDGTVSAVREFTRAPADPDEQPDYTGPGYSTSAGARRGGVAKWPKAAESLVTGTVQNSQLYFGGLLEVLDQVSSVKIGPKASEIIYPIRIEPEKDDYSVRDTNAGAEQVIRGQSSLGIDVPPQWTMAYVKIVRKDGVEVPVISVALKSRVDSSVVCPPVTTAMAGLEFIPPLSVTYGGDREFGEDYGFTLHVPLRPPGTTRMTFSVGDRDYMPWSYGRIEAAPEYWDNRPFSFSDSFRIIFQKADGSEIGPVTYSLAPAKSLVETAWTNLAKQTRRELCACGLVRTKGFGHVGGITAEQLGDEKYPLIIAYPTNPDNDDAWYAIAQVHFGREPGVSLASITGLRPPEFAVHRHYLRWSPQSGVMSRTFAVLPSELKQPWVWFDLRDGSRTEPVQIRCAIRQE